MSLRSKSAYILSQNPLVVVGSFGLLDEIPAGVPITILYHLAWWMHPGQVLLMRKKVAALQRRRPARVIFCTNEWREQWFARTGGLEARWLNHNMHVCEKTFNPAVSGKGRSYDAIYASTMEPYKRIQLAAQVKSLFVLTYKSGISSGWNLHQEYPMLAHANYNRKFVDTDVVCDLYNSAACGLALSAREGAMYASMEYLMCGLPVVSTRSAGGRDHYKDPYYWLQVKATPEAVAAGVQHWLSNPPDYFETRRRVMQKVNKDRMAFARFAVSIIGNGETAESFAARVWGGPKGIAGLRVATDTLI